MKYLIIFSLGVFWSQFIYSQTMNVHTKSGITSIQIAEIDSITFITSSIEIPTADLVAYYPFNGNANDESGNGLHGTINGATLTADRFGIENKAYYFDGIDDFINCGSDSAFNLSSEITISTWVKFDSVSGIIIAKWKTESGWRGSWTLGSSSFNITNNGWDALSATSDYEISTNIYYHIVGSYSNNQIKIFVNGVEKGVGGGNGNICISDAKVRIGGNHWYSNGWHDSFVKGTIDDVRIYSRALTIEEIHALFNEHSR